MGSMDANVMKKCPNGEVPKFNKHLYFVSNRKDTCKETCFHLTFRMLKTKDFSGANLASWDAFTNRVLIKGSPGIIQY